MYNKLTEEKLKENNETIDKLIDKYEIMNDELKEFLGDNFYTAPASVTTESYNCFKGGLVDHLINTITFALKFNNSLPDNLQVDKKSLARVCGLYEISKVYLFLPNDVDWEIEKRGKLYKYNNDLTSMQIGEMSAYYCFLCNNKLSDIEYQAILNYEKKDFDRMAYYHNSTIGDLLKTANFWAIKYEKQKQKEDNDGK